MRLRATLGLALTCSLLVACSADDDPAADPPSSVTEGTGETQDPAGTTSATLRPLDAPSVVVPGATPIAIAVGASETFFEQSPAVVVADDGDEAAQQAATVLAVELGVPMLLVPASAGDASPTDSATPPTGTTEPTSTAGSPAPVENEVALTLDEIERLQATTVVAVGPGAAALGDVLDGVTVVAGDGAAAAADLPEDVPALQPAEPDASVLAMLDPELTSAAAQATAGAAGAEVRKMISADPRGDPALIALLAGTTFEHVVALGPSFGTADQLAYRMGVAATGVQLPGGGQLLYPYHRHVALYGNPTSAALGSLGEQPLPESITRVKALAEEYQAFTDATVVPTFEVIASVASSVPSSGGDYSTEMSAEDIRPYVDAAAEAGVYVVLDLQPGRTDFLTQAKQFEEFLAQPHVGLALDPEWRLKPGQVHLEQVGTVTAAEINTVVTWLADLTRANNLPQKLLLLHEFKTSMISDRTTVDTTRDELAVLIHVDGFGPPGAKLSTWNTLRQDPPPNVWWGWKNFIDEDSPTFTPEETMAIDPVPHFVSYQ